jgi:hypothetical protein
MPFIAPIIASVALILSGWLYTHPVQQTPALGASQTISSLTAGSSLDDADVLPYTETSSLTTKKITWGNATSTLKTFYDTVYSPIFSTSAGFFALISDETGSSGGVVRAGSPTITTPSITTPALDVAGTDATGDIYYNGGSGVLTRLAIGANQKYLMASTTGLAEWSSDYLLTNPQTSSSTFTATTSFNGSSLTNNAVGFNGLFYQLPSTRGNPSKQFLTDNGTGILTFASTTGIVVSTTTDASYASGATVDIVSMTIPAGTLTTNGVIHGHFYIDWIDASATGKSLTVTFGGSSCVASNSLDLGGSATYRGYLDFDIITTTSATAQECSLVWDGIAGTTIAQLYGVGSASIDNSTSKSLVITATQNSSGETVSVRNGYIEVIK